MPTITLVETTDTRVQKEDEKKTDAPESVFKTTTAHKLNTDPNKNCNALDTKSKCNANPTICRWDVDSRKCLQIVNTMEELVENIQIVNTMEELVENIQTNVLALSRQGSAEQIAGLLTTANIITPEELEEGRSKLKPVKGLSRSRSSDNSDVVDNPELLEAVTNLLAEEGNLRAAEGTSYDHVIPPQDLLEGSLYGDNMEIEIVDFTGYDLYIGAIGDFMEQLPSISRDVFSTIRSGLNNIWQTARRQGGNILSMLLEFFTNIMNNITELTEYLPSTEAVLNRFLESMKNIIRVLNKIFALIGRGSVSASTALGHLINACVKYIGEAINYLIEISPAVLLQIQTVGGDIAEKLITAFRNLLKGFYYLSYHIINNVLVPIGRSIRDTLPHIIDGTRKGASYVMSELVKLLKLLNNVSVKKPHAKKDTKRVYSRSPDARKGNFKADSKKHTNVQSKKVVEDPNYDPSPDVDNTKRHYRERTNNDIGIAAQLRRPRDGLNIGDKYGRVEGYSPSETTALQDRATGEKRKSQKPKIYDPVKGKGGNMTRRKMSRRKMSRRKMIRRKMSRRK